MEIIWIVGFLVLGTAVGTFVILQGLIEWLGDRFSLDDLISPQRVRSLLHMVNPPQWFIDKWAAPEEMTRVGQANLPLGGADFISLRWLSLWLGLGVGLSVLAARNGDFIGITLGVLLSLVGALGPELWLLVSVDNARQEVEHSLPDFNDRLSLGLEAGLGFELALRRTAQKFPGLLGIALRGVIRKIDRGYSRVQALEEMARDIPSEDIKSFVAAVRQSDRLGTSLIRSLKVQSELMRARRRRKAQEASRRLPILIVFPLVFFFLPALMIIYLAPPLLLLFLGGN